MSNRATPGRQHGIELARGLFPATKWGSVQHFCQGKLPETKLAKVMWGIILVFAAALIAFCFAQWVSSTINMGRSMADQNESLSAVAVPRLEDHIQTVGVGVYHLDDYPVTHYFRVMDGQTTVVAVQATRQNLEAVSLPLVAEKLQVLQNALETNGYLYEVRASRIVGFWGQGARTCNVFVQPTDYTVHCSDTPLTEGLLFPRAMALIGR